MKPNWLHMPNATESSPFSSKFSEFHSPGKPHQKDWDLEMTILFEHKDCQCSSGFQTDQSNTKNFSSMWVTPLGSTDLQYQQLPTLTSCGILRSRHCSAQLAWCECYYSKLKPKSSNSLRKQRCKGCEVHFIFSFEQSTSVRDDQVFETTYRTSKHPHSFSKMRSQVGFTTLRS